MRRAKKIKWDMKPSIIYITKVHKIGYDWVKKVLIENCVKD